MNVPEKLEVPLVVKDTDGNEHEVERLVYRLERNGKSRWHELFGTPERAALTLAVGDRHADCGECVICEACYSSDMGCLVEEPEVLLEWLRGDEE